MLQCEPLGDPPRRQGSGAARRVAKFRDPLVPGALDEAPHECRVRFGEMPGRRGVFIIVLASLWGRIPEDDGAAASRRAEDAIR